ncbi:FkbM family methyltransferase [Marimonas arenosa]|uniref:FkbM family methyltransferase n=1 Tax=Marimonas arenosa TaxID=1795305 RepID=A0AAE3W8A7_9RHOB|nr:FkbM family methyltransferase [Marimonas arenosa]MDQ2088471.1 FkbM family methyltransferase [Marimonas arenosa]
MPKPSLTERLRVLNDRRIENRRLAKPFQRTADGFLYKGIPIQFSADWEARERRLVHKLLSGADRFVNVGAHYGYFTCLARSAGVAAIAFEPIDANFHMLLDNLTQNDFDRGTLLIHAAAGDENAVATITGAFSGATLTANSRKPASLNQKTPVVRIDDVVPDIAGQTLFLVDVEGFEYFALRGAARHVADCAHNSWIVEITGSTINRDGALVENTDYRATFEMFLEAGYQVWSIGPDPMRMDGDALDAAMRADPRDRPRGNFLFLSQQIDIEPLLAAMA